jgi:protein TonB
MISVRGIAMSLVMHGVAAALVSVAAAIRPDTPIDVAAIPVELVLEMESAPVTPSAPVEEIVETPVVETPVEEIVEAPVVKPPVPEPVTPAPEIKPEPPLKTASLDVLPKPKPTPQPEPELVTQREMPVQVPPIVEEKQKLAEQLVARKVMPEKPVQKILKTEKPKEAKLKKSAKKTLTASQKKQVAALAAGKGSVGKQRSTDGRAAESSYNNKVLARLRAAKKYPAAARGKGIEGTAILSFTISSSGRLTSARVVKGAGHALLDSAVLAMARNAAPFPAFPSSISKSQMTFSVPVQFKIN